MDRKNKFCTNIITRPSPNSTADNIRKKNVNDSKLRLSNNKPSVNTMMYNVIHKNSAVSSKCNAVLMFRAILINNKEKRIITKLKSPNNIK